MSDDVLQFPKAGAKPAKKPVTVDDMIARHLDLPPVKLLKHIAAEIPSASLYDIHLAITRENPVMQQELDRLSARLLDFEALYKTMTEIANGLDPGDADAPLSHTLRKAEDRGWI